MSIASLEDTWRPTATYLVWSAFCALAILLLFVPLDSLVSAALRMRPFSYRPSYTGLLFQTFKIVLPLLAALCLLWLNFPRRFRSGATRFVRRALGSRWAIPSILLLSASLQLAWLNYYPTTPYADSQWYYEKAIDLSSGRGYIYDVQTGKPTAAWPVGYPAALAFLFVISGPSQLIAKLANVLFSALIVLATYLVARRLFNPYTAVASALFIAVLPGLVVYNSLINSDLLFLLLMLSVLGLVLMDVQMHVRSALWATFLVAGIGLLNGAMVLTRSAGLSMFPVFGLLHWLALSKRPVDRPAFVRWILAFAFGTGLVLLPWMVRNYLHFDKIVPVSTNGGLNFWMGNNPLATGGYVFPRDPETNPLLTMLGDEIAVDETGYQLGKEFIYRNPVRTIRLLPAKVFYLYYANDDGLEWNLRSAVTSGHPGSGELAFIIVNVAYVLLTLSALPGLTLLAVRWRSHPPEVWTGVILAVAWTAIHLPFFGTNRFALPVLPFIAIYSAYGWIRLLHIDSSPAN